MQDFIKSIESGQVGDLLPSLGTSSIQHDLAEMGRDNRRGGNNWEDGKQEVPSKRTIRVAKGYQRPLGKQSFSIFLQT